MGQFEAGQFEVAHEPDFDFGSPEYAQLYARSEATMFQHPAWLRHLYGSLAPAVGADPLVVTVRRGPELVGVLPLVKRRNRGVRKVEFADLGVSDYAAPVLDRDAAAAVLADGSVPRGVRAAIGKADLVVIDKVRGDAGPTATLLGARQTVQHPWDAHPIPLPATVTEWRSGRDTEFLRHLERKRARIGRKKRVLGLRELTDVAEIEESFEQMAAFRRARFAERRAVDLIQEPEYAEFYRQVAVDGAKGGPGSTSVLTINDDVVGVSFGIFDDDSDVFVLIGYDFDQWRNYSLGLVLVEDLIEVSIATGKSVHDLTLGHEGYKLAFGAVPTPMYSVRLPLTVAGRAARVAADLEQAARKLAKRALAYYEKHLKGRKFGRRPAPKI